jgi:hypothetical protein
MDLTQVAQLNPIESSCKKSRRFDAQQGISVMAAVLNNHPAAISGFRSRYAQDRQVQQRAPDTQIPDTSQSLWQGYAGHVCAVAATGRSFPSC